MEYAQLNPADTNIHRMPQEIKSDLSAVLRENPWAGVGIAAGIGFGAGVLIGALVTLLARRA